MTIGDAMRRARMDAGVTMKDLALMAGIAYATIQSMETGVRTPSILVAEACADVLGISIDEYIGRDTKKKEDE